ncbi:MAG: Gamma-glutamyltranspeptidase [bacterium]|nr:Gamma-glutamyltranspeptidase [bacterium]
MARKKPGVVAAGHPATAEAAREILADGGNAFDAAVAGCFAACVAEPILASLGGGGFLLARTEEGRESVFDFFAQTPIEKRPGGFDLFPIECDFGGAFQTFHIGRASIATPGLVRGLFRIHRDLGTLPMARLVAPAARLAREGSVIDEVRELVQESLRPILVSTPEAARLFAGEDTALGRTWRSPQLADVMTELAAEGEDFFYRGELAEALVSACGSGGHLTHEDLRSFRVIRRGPLSWRYRGHRLAGNPPPSTGASLIAFALKVLEGADAPSGRGFGSRGHLGRLFHTMKLTNHARAETLSARDPRQRQLLLRADLLAPYQRSLREHLTAFRGTTHLSVADHHGNLASLSVSNGEGSGFVLPGTGIMLNNMLGEKDLHPAGLSRWPENQRLASMMSPTLLERSDGRLVTLGSGGSNRLRTAVLQVLVNLLELDLPLEDAVRRPRIHLEGGRLDVEPGWPEGAIETLREDVEEFQVWDRLNLFFGGVHAVAIDPRAGTVDGAGDPRRGGVVVRV